MDELANQIAQKVVADTKYFTAIIGLIGVVIGSLLTIIGNILLHILKQRSDEVKIGSGLRYCIITFLKVTLYIPKGCDPCEGSRTETCATRNMSQMGLVRAPHA